MEPTVAFAGGRNVEAKAALDINKCPKVWKIEYANPPPLLKPDSVMRCKQVAREWPLIDPIGTKVIKPLSKRIAKES